jgi:putative transposase
MPEHVHLVIWPADSRSSLGTILSTIKQSVAKRSLVYIHEHAPSFLPKMEDRQPNGKTTYRFWQRGGGYDRNLVEPATVWNEITYLHMNPVRRGLCDEVAGWPWSSARELNEAGSGLIRLDRSSMPRWE